MSAVDERTRSLEAERDALRSEVAKLEERAARYAELAREQSERLERLLVDRERRDAAALELAAEIESIGRDLVAARDEADASGRAKAGFLANMSHEIRTPLNAILGTASLLEETSLDDEQREYVRTLKLAGDHLLGVIRDILDFSKIDAGTHELERTPFRVRELVPQAISLASGAAREGVTMSAAIEDDVPTSVTGDPSRLRQVLVNLLSNAVKFTEAGKIEVVVSARSEGAGHRLVFEVRDTGVGIPPATLARLFQPFVQADVSTTRTHGGTGLGLVISRRLVELMGGRIDAESRVGGGSVFRFDVRVESAVEGVASGPGGARPPSAPDATVGPTAPTPPVAGALAPARLRVLLVEDNVVNQRVALEMLRRLGHAADVAESGEAALERVAETSYDVVLMDVQMPGMDGLEATRRIRARAGAQPRIVGLTADAFEHTRARCLAAGMNDFLAKPFRMATLAEVVAGGAAQRASAS